MARDKYRDNNAVCPRRSDPFYIVGYIFDGSLLLGHLVQTPN